MSITETELRVRCVEAVARMTKEEEGGYIRMSGVLRQSEEGIPMVHKEPTAGITCRVPGTEGVNHEATAQLPNILPNIPTKQ